MQNINNEDIFGLVNSLTKSEKAYFKKYSNQHVKGDKNDYMLVFEIFEKTYDNKKINFEKEFEKLKITNISRVKNYLHDVILKSLISYHAENSIDAEIREDLRKIEVLWNKSLHEQCSKLLAKVKKNIEKYDKKQFLLEVLEWESKLIVEKPTINGVFNDLLSNRDHFLFTLQGITKQVEYDFLGRSFSLSFQSKHQELISNNLTFISNVEKLIVKNSEEVVEDGNLKISHYLVTILYYISNKNYDQAKATSEKLLNYVIQNENYIVSNLVKYIAIIIVNVVLNYDLKDLKNAKRFVEILDKIENKYSKFCSDEIKNILKFEYIICSINLLIEDNNDIELQQFIIKEVEECAIDTEFSHLSREAVYYFSISRAYFNLNNYKLALLWLNKLFNNKKFEASYLYNNALVYELIVHYELNNFDYIENKIRSLKRYFKMNNNIELNIIKVLEKYIIDKMDKIEIYELKNSIENDEIIQKFSTNFGKFSFVRWINKKM